MENKEKKIKSKKRLIIKIVVFSLLAVILLPLAFVGVVAIYSSTYSIPKQAASIENNTGLVQASNHSLYDEDGNRLILRGVNFGNIFLQEGWLSPLALEPLKNDDGTYQRDNDGNIKYPEFCQEEFYEGLLSNPNCGEDNYQTWFDYYFHAWVNDSDYDLISDELGLNCIRLPIYWRDILNDDFSRKPASEAFYYIDQIIESAKAHNIYIVLDLHGVPGSQNGYEHSGYPQKSADFWNNETYVNAAVDIWDYISDYYLNTRSDLSSTIATYDLLNEPSEVYGGITTSKCWKVFDRMYDTIRDNGDNHVVTIEGIWSFNALPNPKDYGWENVQYEYHWYNYSSSTLPYTLFYMYQDMNNMFRDFNVPVYIGEFTYFEDKDEWQRGFELFEKRGYSWTVWNFKGSTVGWWNTSWAVLSCPLYMEANTDERKVNVSTCTFEEFKKACDSIRSSKCNKHTLYNALLTYKNSYN